MRSFIAVWLRYAAFWLYVPRFAPLPCSLRAFIHYDATVAVVATHTRCGLTPRLYLLPAGPHLVYIPPHSDTTLHGCVTDACVAPFPNACCPVYTTHIYAAYTLLFYTRGLLGYGCVTPGLARGGYLAVILHTVYAPLVVAAYLCGLLHRFAVDMLPFTITLVHLGFAGYSIPAALLVYSPPPDPAAFAVTVGRGSGRYCYTVGWDYVLYLYTRGCRC